MALTLKSTAFENGAEIPAQYTSDAKDVSPPLRWEGVPAAAQSQVLIVDDPDAPDPQAPRMVWVHWLLYNLPAQSSGLDEAISEAALPPGALQGRNDWHRLGYGGPAPPIGRHRYFFKLYALDCLLPNLNEPNKQQLETAMQGHIIEQAELMGMYQKR